MSRLAYGHAAAFLTIVLWGTTFISTKVLLDGFQPVEILFFRFVIGTAALLMVYPHRLRHTARKQEITFAIAGLCGICLYYLLENIALTYTRAANVGVIISIAPFFTAVLSRIGKHQEEKLHMNFFIGFLIAMAGICMISFQSVELQLNPLGDFLGVGAALAWACYAVLTKRVAEFGYPTILTTRRIFCYGLLWMLPAMLLFDFRMNLTRFFEPLYFANMLFLGLGASALCFVTWNSAVRILGAVKTSVYIYMVPVITVAASMLILHEELTAATMTGTLFTLIGLIISEYRTTKEKENASCKRI